MRRPRRTSGAAFEAAMLAQAPLSMEPLRSVDVTAEGIDRAEIGRDHEQLQLFSDQGVQLRRRRRRKVERLP